MATYFDLPRLQTVGLAALLGLACIAAMAQSSAGLKGAPAAFNAECTSCHIGYAPGLAGVANWRAIMGGLDKHFGVDASIDEKSRLTISAWLISHAAKGSQYASASPEFRISKSQWFVRQHDEVSRKVWKRASVKSPANCGACHGGAGQGDFDEDRVRIPS
jgi:nitrate/TMAO reductase-like tetraheme cytochrome c subunit